MIQANAFWSELKRLGIHSESRVLLALSGGMDSVVLFHLLKNARIAFSAAHVNYGLRGTASDGDEAFCRELCAQFHIPCFVYNAKAEMEARTHTSIQEAARDIRYRFFNELLEKEGFNGIATAHHANDSVETFFVNLLRGSGAQGLGGIPDRNGEIIRPMLSFSKAEVEAYAQQNRLPFREDASNQKDDYLRNRIRHHVIPALNKTDPSAISRVQETMAKLSAEAELLSLLLQEKFPSTWDKTAISLFRAFPLSVRATVLFKRFQALGLNYSQAQDMAEALEGIPGKRFYTATHRLLIDREYIVAEPQETAPKEAIFISNESIEIPGYKTVISSPSELELVKNSAYAYIDLNTLSFPLVWRAIEAGDSMVPMGMKGKKKISDILIDTKKTRFEKENLHVLCSGSEIVWLEGFRVSDSSKITAQTSRILCLIPEKL